MKSIILGIHSKNVWMSDKSWEPDLTLSLSQSLIHSLSAYWTSFVFMSMLKRHSHTLTLSQCLTLSLFHSLIHSLSTCWTTFVFMSMLKNHSLTFTLSHSHTLSFSHSITLDMLNKFCFHLYAQKSLFIAENCNVFFGTSAPDPVTHEFIELVPS